MRPAVPAGVPGMRAAAVARPAAVVFLRVAVEDLFPETAVRNADFVIVTDDRRKIRHDHDRVSGVLSFAQKTQNAVCPSLQSIHSKPSC